MFVFKLAFLKKNTIPAQWVSGFADFPAMLDKIQMKRVNQSWRNLILQKNVSFSRVGFPGNQTQPFADP
jgi:hypothetical protein